MEHFSRGDGFSTSLLCTFALGMWYLWQSQFIIHSSESSQREYLIPVLLFYESGRLSRVFSNPSREYKTTWGCDRLSLFYLSLKSLILYHYYSQSLHGFFPSLLGSLSSMKGDLYGSHPIFKGILAYGTLLSPVHWNYPVLWESPHLRTPCKPRLSPWPFNSLGIFHWDDMEGAQKTDFDQREKSIFGRRTMSSRWPTLFVWTPPRHWGFLLALRMLSSDWLTSIGRRRRVVPLPLHGGWSYTRPCNGSLSCILSGGEDLFLG